MVNVILTILAYIYIFIAGIMVLVFNWQFAREHGFLAWLFFGEIVATFKGIFWVFFI